MSRAGIASDVGFLLQLRSSELRVFVFSKIFGCVTWLVGSQFPDQGWNPHPWQ